jgi:hypothetical protein
VPGSIIHRNKKRYALSKIAVVPLEIRSPPLVLCFFM